METTIQKWGNSQGIRISRHFLAEAQLGVGDQVNLVVEGDAIIIRKAPKKKYDLAELVVQIPKDHKVKEESFGAPVGKEVW